MDQKFKKINHLRQESLTKEEKDLMRGNISSFIDASLNLKSRNTFVQSVMGYMKSGAFVPSLLVILILGGGISTFASQNALPGDAMYPLKQLSEKVDLAFAFTSSAQARVNAIQAVRRLEEAEALSASGKLDVTTKVALENSFSVSSNNTLKKIEEIGVQDKNTGQKVLTEFRGNLSAHKDILQSIALVEDHTSTSNILPHAVSKVMAVLSSPTTSAIDVGIETDDSAEDARRTAEARISDVEKYIGANMTGDAKVKATDALISAKASYENGSEALDADSYINAVVLFKQSTDQAMNAKAVAESYNSAKKIITKITSQAKAPKPTFSLKPVRATKQVEESVEATSTATSTEVKAEDSH